MPISLLGTTGANTGDILGDVSRGVIKKIFIYGGELEEADYADAASIEAALVAASLLKKTDANKIFPLPEVQDITDSSEANKEGTLNLGFKTTLLEGRPAFVLKMFAGSTLVKNLRRFNNKTVRFLELDANDKFWGTMDSTDYIGCEAKLFFTGNKSATGQNVEEGVVTLTLSIMNVSEYYDECKYLDVADVNMNSIKELHDAQLREISNVDNVYKIAVEIETTEAGGVLNMYDDVADELASAALWEAHTGANFGTALTITSVAKDTALEAWTVTFDSTAYTALAGGAEIRLNLKTPATLDAADVTDIEGIPVTVTK